MSSVHDKDRGYGAMLKRVYGIGQPQVAMGILAKDGAAAKKGPEGDEPLQVIDVAGWMEFGFTMADGTEVPARSYIRAWWDEANPQLRADFTKLLQSVVQGKRTKEEILNLIGLRGQGQIQKRIADGIPPPNAPSTIAKKGSSTPLIGETGQLRSSVSFAVREAGK